MDVKLGALLELWQLVEQGGGGQAAVPHQHRMRAFAAYGQGGALQMAHAHLQNQVAGAVINREVHANFRNFQIPHHILKGEQAIIACGGLLPIGLRRRLGQLAL